MIKIKIKKIGKDSKLPQRQKDGDAGFDCFIHEFKSPSNQEKGKIFKWDHNEANLSQLQRIICSLGFATEIPKGYYCQLVPRSGLAVYSGLTVLNTPATIDSGFRNEWHVTIINTSDEEVKLNVGDRICQIIIRKLVDFEFEETEELSKSERGLDGLGSTGK